MKIATAGVGVDVAFPEREPIPSTTDVPIVQSLQKTSSVAGEEMRVLRASLERISSSRGLRQGLRCLGVVSALPGDGKSTVATGLAAALAREKGRRILLIDADLRRSSISRSLGLANAPGLNDWLEGAIDEAPVHLVEAGGFFLLSAGSSVLTRPEVLSSPRMEALLKSARKRFDFVIVDTTPVIPVSDAVILQRFVDGLLLVVRARKTPREAILDCLARLRRGAVVGVVLNDCLDPRSSYRHDAYSKYGLTYDHQGPKGSSSKQS